MLYTTALITTLLTSTCPNGQCVVPFNSSPALQTQTPPATVVRVINRGRDGSSLGSGTIIASDAEQAIVLTCAHLFCDGIGRLSIRFPDGRAVEARLVAIDRQWDLAAMAIAPVDTIRPPPIATNAPKQGESLSSCGYGPDGKFMVNRGTVRGYVRAAGTKTFETLEMTGCARQGDSGGPILNRAGELVAVLWGSDGRTVGGTYCGRIRRFLARVLGRAKTPPASELSPSIPALPAGPPLDFQIPDLLGGVSNAGRLTQLSDGISKIHSRLESFTDRLGRIESVATKIQSIGLLNGSSTSGAWLPAVMAALGWTAPPSLALMIGLRLGGRFLRRRIRKRGRRRNRSPTRSSEKATAKTVATTVQEKSKQRTINDDYARQLAQVYSLSGRSALGDVTLGREYDEELRQAESSSDARLADWAGALRRRVADRFNRIHDSAPTPADPVEQ